MRGGFWVATAVFGYGGVFAAPTETRALHPRFGNGTSNSNATTIATPHQPGGKEYVVLFDPDHPEPPAVSHVLEQIGLHSNHPDVLHVYNNSAFRGFAGNMKNHCLTALNNMTTVKFVEEAFNVESMAVQTRKDSPWGLQRLSQQGAVNGDASSMNFEYKYDNTGNLGKGVDIYILDTGINTDHLAFGGRAKMGYSKSGPTDLNAAADHFGHGTHVAGTAAGDVFGVASGANLIGVKVLGNDGSGTSSDTIKGIDWVIQQHDQRKTAGGFVGSIVSMSLGSPGRSQSMDQAINLGAANGVHFSVAAGNQKEDACQGSPSSSGGSGGKAVGVGSINIQDNISTFSNTGPCVDVYAPGENIISTWVNGTDTVNTLSGTSMATPHVTGLMAYLMSQDPKLASCPACMKDFLASSSVGKSLQNRKLMTLPDLGLLVNNGLGLNSVSSAPSNGSFSISKRL